MASHLCFVCVLWTLFALLDCLGLGIGGCTVSCYGVLELMLGFVGFVTVWHYIAVVI